MKPVTFGSYDTATSGAATLDAKIKACRRMDTTTCIFFIIPMMSFSSLGADSIGQANGSSAATSRLGGKSRPGSSAKKTGVRPWASFTYFALSTNARFFSAKPGQSRRTKSA